MAAVHLHDGASAADCGALRRHRLAELVAQDEGRLVGHVEIAAELQGVDALHRVHEDHDGRHVVPDMELVVGEQRTAGRAEVAPASLAASRSPTASTGETSRARRLSWLDPSLVAAPAGLPNHAAAVASTTAALRMLRAASVKPESILRSGLSCDSPLSEVDHWMPTASGTGGIISGSECGASCVRPTIATE